MSEAMNDSFLDDMQREWLALLKSDELLGMVPILNERLGDVAAEVNKQLGLTTKVDGKIGACVIAQSPTADDESPAVHGGILETEWTFLTLEEPLLNDSAKGHQISALTLARRIVRVGKLYAATGLCTAVVPGKPTIVPVGNPLASIAYRVSMRCTEHGQGKNLKVAQPTIAPASGAAPQAVTITCATAGASIYYTLDGSHPWSGNGQLYAGPVNVVAAGTLRARAFKAGYVGSNTAAADFT